MGESIGFPSKNTTDTLNKVGSVVIPDTLSTNVLEVHQFLFGNDGYTVSGTVQGIEGGIQTRAADRADSSTDWDPADEEDDHYTPQNDNSYNNNSYNSNSNSNSSSNSNSNYGTGDNGGGGSGSTDGTDDGGGSTGGDGNYDPVPEEPSTGGTGDGGSSEGGAGTE